MPAWQSSAPVQNEEASSLRWHLLLGAGNISMGCWAPSSHTTGCWGLGRASTLLPTGKTGRYPPLGQASGLFLIPEHTHAGRCLGWSPFVVSWATTTIVGFVVVVFKCRPSSPPVKTKGICMYFQSNVCSSLTSSLQGFALECTEHFQHHRYQWEGDASPPWLLSRSDCTNKHIMALQALTLLASLSLSRVTDVQATMGESALDLRCNMAEKGSQTMIDQMFLRVPPLLCWSASCFSKSSSEEEKKINQFLCKWF